MNTLIMENAEQLTIRGFADDLTPFMTYANHYLPEEYQVTISNAEDDVEDDPSYCCLMIPLTALKHDPITVYKDTYILLCEKPVAMIVKHAEHEDRKAFITFQVKDLMITAYPSKTEK